MALVPVNTASVLVNVTALEKEHGEAVDLMRAIKCALDPQNLMNPGKIFL